jgi:hypothetical protein
MVPDPRRKADPDHGFLRSFFEVRSAPSQSNSTGFSEKPAKSMQTDHSLHSDCRENPRQVVGVPVRSSTALTDGKNQHMNLTTGRPKWQQSAAVHDVAAVLPSAPAAHVDCLGETIEESITDRPIVA